MRGYDLADWEPFFSAIIAAAAALTGLLFVAVSINLDRILRGAKFLPARAARPWPPCCSSWPAPRSRSSRRAFGWSASRS
jgi:hypothetical protein